MDAKRVKITERKRDKTEKKTKRNGKMELVENMKKKQKNNGNTRKRLGMHQ